MIGRTIVGVERDPEDSFRWLLRLDDGTAVEFAAESYGREVEETTVTHLTEEVLRQRAAADEAERVANAEERRRNAEAAERQRAHVEQMRAELAPKAFEKWRRETYPTVSETLKDVWTSPRIAEQFASPLTALLGDEQPVAPLTKRKARRS